MTRRGPGEGPIYQRKDGRWAGSVHIRLRGRSPHPQARPEVSRNVAKLVDTPRVPRHEMRPLTPREARRLIEASVEDRYRGLWVTALGTGLREGELLGLRWEDVDLDAGRLRVRHTLGNVEGTLTLLEPKTDRSRRLVVLPSVVVEALRAHRTPPEDGPPRGRITLDR